MNKSIFFTKEGIQMAINQKLYQDLFYLRQQLKMQGQHKTGKMPLVCNDDALESIAEMCPKKVDDLKGIPGVGNVFIENYGEKFIEVVHKHVTVETEKTINLGNNATSILKELEKKLVNINRRNRLLYMPKLASKYGYDLSMTETINPLDVCFGNGQPIVLSDLSNITENELEIKKYKSIVSLLREINKDLRDKGQNDLYIGYPFVIGRIPGENFDVRCPLMLFPVLAEKTPTSITIKMDDSRDVLYNSTFILAFYKFNNINQPLPPSVAETVESTNFINSIINYYKQISISISASGESITRFREYNASEFPHFEAGELKIENSIVLGKFPVCSSSIQKDFDDILENGSINSLLNELLLEVNDFDYESDSYSGDVEKKEDDVQYTVSERNLTYINELDSSQENVLSAINRLDELVIQGPPGTGKSQTITSLIAKFVNSEKTVLMVSEKKTALDVVYSRLGELSKYALLIDDVGNKELFYQQMSKMFMLGEDPDFTISDNNEIANDIDHKISTLENIAAKLYKCDSFGIEPYKVYIENKKSELLDPIAMDKMATVHRALSSEIMSMKYDELSRVHKQFENEELLRKLEFLYDTFQQHQWLFDVKRGMSEFDLLQLYTDMNSLADNYNLYKEKNFIVRLFTYGKIRNEANAIIHKFFMHSNKETVKMFTGNQEYVKQAFGKYAEFDTIRTLYEQLTVCEKKYFELLMVAKRFSDNSLKKANDDVYNQILQEHISIFEAANREVLQDIDNYKFIVQSLSEAISKKKELTRRRLEIILSHSMGNISYAKRKGEIERAIESKRKWSVNKFISKFSFEIFKGVKIWLLTPEVVSEIIPLDTGIFDLVIFDEASQMYVEKGLPAIYRAKKVVIAGDHKQLRPSNLGSGRIELDEDELPEDVEETAALGEESLLDLARYKYKPVMLNFHYRAKYEELIAFSNYAFYHGLLHVSPNVEKPETPPIEVHKMENAMWANRSNYEEAKFIVALLRKTLDNRKGDDTIGVITFNSSQRDLIMDLLDEQCALDASFASAIRAEYDRKQDGEDIGLFIKNIESVQGDERDIIIFSIGYAKNEYGKLVRNFGWLNQKGGENRLNVAISRAKKKIHIVTSFNPEELQVEDSKNDGPRLLKKYLQYTKAISDSDKEAAEQILLSFGDDSEAGQAVSFDSDFENQVYDSLNDRLREKGISVDTQVGIGGYSIDLALKKDGKYLLGIECDGKTYHSSKSARERDYHRQKYLESRGWKIHRIWSTNWWKNPVGEINKICAVAETMI